MRNYFTIILCVVLSLTCLTACREQPSDGPVTTTSPIETTTATIEQTTVSDVTTTTGSGVSTTTSPIETTTVSDVITTTGSGGSTTTSTTTTARRSTTTTTRITTSTKKTTTSTTTTTTKHDPADNNTVKIPDPAKKDGFENLVFSDSFDDPFSIDYSGEGEPGHLWYIDRPYGTPPLSTDDFSVTDSVLTIAPEIESCNYALSTYSKKGDTGFVWRYGYAEARIRMPVKDIPTKEQGRDGWPAFWGISFTDVLGKPWEECGELDIMECYHDAKKNEVWYSGALHDHKRIPGGKVIGTNLINANGYNGVRKVMTDGWHTYGALWKEGHVSWYVDGELMHTVEFEEGKLPTFYFRDNPSPLPSKESERNWVGAHTIMNEEELVVVLGTDKQWPIEVDWVRVWA